MPRSQEEFRLNCFVADAIERDRNPDVLWTHFPSGEKRAGMAGARLKRMGLKPGWPDLIFFLPDSGMYRRPRVAFLELKSAGGRLSPAQKAFKASAEALGCLYEIARTGNEAIGILNGWGVLRRTRIAA